MAKKAKFFGTAGIRGLYGIKVTHKLVLHVSQTIAELYPNRGIVIGHDARTSSETLSYIAISSLLAKGVLVNYAGLCSFPVIANLTLNHRHPVAIFITASHNPPEYNGIKVLHDGREFNETEQDEIEKIVLERLQSNKLIFNSSSWRNLKPLQSIAATEEYIRRLNKTILLQGDGRTIIVDCANGPMSLFVPKYLSDRGFRVVSINSHVDGSFPGRFAEPTPTNLSLLIKLCKEEQAIGAAFDGDGDRIAFIDEKGNFLELSRVNALFAEMIARNENTGKIVVSIDSSTCIDKHVSKFGISVIRTKLGKLHSKIEELKNNGEKVIFAAEPWKPIFPNWGLWIDGMYGLALMLNELTNFSTSLNDLIKKVPEHYAQRKAYYVDEKRADFIYQQWLEIMSNTFSKTKKSELHIDGVRYDLTDGTWMLIRKSGTEPKIRVYYESPKKEEFNKLEETVLKMEKFIKKDKVRNDENNKNRR
ncbi:MAG: hypothetical protein ACTSYD_11535 [Candidatus Heimdallarchaeaceae archaeon]